MAANHDKQMGDILYFVAAAAWIHYYTCCCEGLIHWIISLMNENSFSKRNGSGCSEEPQKNGCIFSASPWVRVRPSTFFFSSCFSSLEHLIQINSCYLMLRLLLLIHTSPPSDHSPVPFHRSLFSSPSFFFLILSIPHVPTSSAPPPPHHRSYPPLFSLCQWAHPASLGPLKCINSSQRYPSPLTSALAGCLPSSLNGLINPS